MELQMAASARSAAARTTGVIAALLLCTMLIVTGNSTSVRASSPHNAAMRSTTPKALTMVSSVRRNRIALASTGATTSSTSSCTCSRRFSGTWLALTSSSSSSSLAAAAPLGIGCCCTTIGLAAGDVDATGEAADCDRASFALRDATTSRCCALVRAMPAAKASSHSQRTALSTMSKTRVHRKCTMTSGGIAIRVGKTLRCSIPK
mmetsp:Transcript_50346/g.155598  ORF Transcript_50346/g.155598 Transcript_50346/m.155598 type:complete len:205 (+) Transcript_50346:486-1100(+)